MVMNHSKCWVASLLAVSALTAAFSQQTSATNGAIIDQKPCVFGPYDQQSEFTRRYYSKEEMTMQSPTRERSAPESNTGVTVSESLGTSYNLGILHQDAFR